MYKAEPQSQRQQGPLTGEVLSVRDVMQSEDIELKVHDRGVPPERVLLRGKRDHRILRPGLCLYRSDIREEAPFTSTAIQPPGLSCIFFLRGRVDVRFGKALLRFQGDPTAAVVTRGSKETFQRISRGPQRVKALIITATPEWLLASGAERGGGQLSRRLLKNEPLAFSGRWRPDLQHKLREIFAPPEYTDELLNLYLESRVVEVIADAVTRLLEADGGYRHAERLTYQDKIRLRRARDFIAQSADRTLSVETIAREANLSPSSLQRLFRRAEGVSVFEYVRKVRLQRAMTALRTEGVSVKEACAIAGYSSPANFATAFKRHFGINPRDVR